jgi:hypothetical protein
MMLGRQWRMPSPSCYNAVLTTLEFGVAIGPGERHDWFVGW